MFLKRMLIPKRYETMSDEMDGPLNFNEHSRGREQHLDEKIPLFRVCKNGWGRADKERIKT